MTERQEIDLTSALWTGNTPKRETKIKSDFIIDWGDSRVFFRTNGSDKSILSHTYKKPDVYTIKLYGTINWFNAHDTIEEKPSSDAKTLAAFLTKINVPNVCPIKNFIGSVYNYGAAFTSSYKLESVSGDVWSGLDLTENIEEDLVAVFYKCKALKAVPKEFKFPNLTKYSIHGLFNTTGISEIPENFFSSLNPAAETLIINDCFAQTLITSIPENLFANLPASSTVYYAISLFGACSHLTSVPNNLFANFPNDSRTRFRTTFHDCVGITGAVPELWVSHPNAQHEACFINCINASNYDQIPDDWKTLPEGDISLSDEYGFGF